ncbi:hypothetical protein EW026_g5360 [Hermanssonia centrifuga]|uniref:Sodium/calcium exchanger membrane region domain-containing protein n=1 Tax=Hermanssonia centrifuga TaxID=98765 RepID=A0A4S4KEJ7_9APHY|nr:hypothetical protein EW026_g5360 [Hermanssonia centrifuga]
MATVSSCEIAEIGMAQGQNTTMSQRWFDLNWKQFKAVVYHSQLNSFLVFIPVSWLLHFTSQADGTNAQDANIFIFSLLSIISLTKLLNFAVSELSIRVGRRLASLLNAISHNIVGLTVATISLINCDVEVVQSTFTGLMLSHLLLVLGMSFVVGGMRCSRNKGSIQLNMLLSSTFAGLAFFFRILYFIASTVIGVDVSEVGQAILALSRWIAFALLIIYMILLSLRGVSLRSIYQRAEKYISAHTEGIHTSNGSATSSSPTHCGREYEHDDDDFSAGMAKDDAEAEAGRCTRNRLTSEKKAHTLSLLVALLFVALFIGLLVRTTQFLMESIDGVTKTTKFSRRFISLILLPIVGRFAEITDCCKAGMDVAEDSDRSRTDDAFESCAQIGWFITPLIIILGRMTGKPLTLLFDTLEVVVLLLSVSIVAHVMTQNNSRLLKGTILLGLYATVAMLFFYYPGERYFCNTIDLNFSQLKILQAAPHPNRVVKDKIIFRFTQ